MKNRLIATVLTLALLCPMMSFLMVTDANAALEVDDSVSLTSASNILNEEWNFDDMAEGETLTRGYIEAHAKGSFSSLTKSTESFCQPENWTAVADAENGGYYVSAENAYFGIEDDACLLLRNTYEISWRMQLTSCSSATTLLWWSDGETVANRRVLLRLNTDGSLGYSKTDVWQGQVYTSTKITIGEDAPWYTFRVRVNPLDGRLWLWLDGELVLDGVVNEYIRDNGKSAEFSRLGIMYAWGGQSFGVRLDDIKITPVQIDEYIDFDSSITPIDEKLDFEELTAGNTVDAAGFNSELAGNALSFSLDGDGSIVSAVDPKNSANKVIKNTNKIIYFDFSE